MTNGSTPRYDRMPAAVAVRLTVRDHGPAVPGQRPSTFDLHGRGLTAVVAGRPRTFGVLPTASRLDDADVYGHSTGVPLAVPTLSAILVFACSIAVPETDRSPRPHARQLITVNRPQLRRVPPQGPQVDPPKVSAQPAAGSVNLRRWPFPVEYSTRVDARSSRSVNPPRREAAQGPAQNLTGVQVIGRGPSPFLVFWLRLTGEARYSCLIWLSGVKTLGPAARWSPG